MEQQTKEMPDAAEHFSVANGLLYICKKYRNQIVFRPSDPQKTHAAAFFAKLLRDVEAAVLLLQGGMVSQARSLLRVAIECEILLAKSCQSPEFVDAYRIANENERRKLGSGVQRITPGRLEDVKRVITQDLVSALKQSLDGTKSEHLEKWATDVGLGDNYQTAYRLFGRDVHSGALSLTKFVNYDDDGWAFEVNWCPEVDNRKEVIEASRIVISGLSRIVALFGLAEIKELTVLQDELVRLVRLETKAFESD